MLKLVKNILMLTLALMLSAVNAQAQVTRECWPSATLTSLQDLANNPNLLGVPSQTSNLGLFEAPLNATGRFVCRYMTKFVPPVTGSYYFWVAGNQQVMLWISPDSPNFANRAPTAWMTSSPPPYSRQWTRYSSQRSVNALPLSSLRTYYLLFVQSEQDGDGINHAAVGWYIPGSPSGIYERPIPGSRLSKAAYPISGSLTASRLDIQHEIETSTLTWTVINGLACNAVSSPVDSTWNGPKALQGTQVMTPIQNTTYTLSCSELSGGPGAGYAVTVTNSYAQRADLAWNPSVSTNVVGYRIYHGHISGNYYQPIGSGINVGLVTAYTLTASNFPIDGQYYFVVTAVGDDGKESVYSNEVSKMIYIP